VDNDLEGLWKEAVKAQFEILSWNLHEVTGKSLVRVVGVSVDIRNDHLSETSQEHYRLIRPISETFVAEFSSCSEIAACFQRSLF
jgi:hypothetical protein